MPGPPAPGPGHEHANQLIGGANFSTGHQTGEGDHGVVAFNGALLLYFIEWDAPSGIHGGTSAGVARSGHTMPHPQDDCNAPSSHLHTRATGDAPVHSTAVTTPPQRVVRSTNVTACCCDHACVAGVSWISWAPLGVGRSCTMARGHPPAWAETQTRSPTFLARLCTAFPRSGTAVLLSSPLVCCAPVVVLCAHVSHRDDCTACRELMAVGVIFSAPLAVAWSSDGVHFSPAAAGPLFNADWSDWNRTPASGELFGYPGMTSSTTSGVAGVGVARCRCCISVERSGS